MPDDRPSSDAATDTLIAVVLALLAAAASFSAANLFDPVSVEGQSGDVYFSADLSRVFDNMTDPGSKYWRANVHPLFPLVGYPPVWVLRAVAGLDPLTATRAVVAAAAGLWTVLVFALLRCVGCRRVDAVLFTLLAATSAAAVFWFAVPETYGFGSLTILSALLFVAAAERRAWSLPWFVALNVVTAGVTVTNWMVGLLATLVLRPWRDVWRVTVTAFAVVVALTVSERALFTRVQLPFAGLATELSLFTRPPSLGGASEAVRTFAVHSMVLPGIRSVENSHDPWWPKQVVDHRLRAWTNPLSGIAAILWVALLLLGGVAFVRIREHRALRIVVAGTLAGQLALHLVYGDETFLYTLHWLPLLVIVAAMSTLTRARVLALALCGVLAVTAGINNTTLLRDAAAHYTKHGVRP